MLNKGIGPNLELAGSEGTFEMWDLAKVFRSLGTRELMGDYGSAGLWSSCLFFVAPAWTGNEQL